MNIRRLQQEDAKQMHNLVKDFWTTTCRLEKLPVDIYKFEKLKSVDQTIEEERHKYMDWISFVAEEEDQLIGFIVGKVTEKPHKEMERIGYIEEFFVIEPNRSKGIGAQLFDKLISEFKKEGCTAVSTDSYVANTSAVKYYMKKGFIPRTTTFIRAI